MKRIIAVITSLVLTVCITCISVFADDEPMTSQEYRASQSWLVAQYAKGKYSWSEFQEQSQSVTDRYLESNTVNNVVSPVALNTANSFTAIANKIGSTVQKYGDMAYQYVSDAINDLISSYEVLRQEVSFDLQGHGAALYCASPTSTNPFMGGQTYYCDYIVIKSGSERFDAMYNNGSKLMQNILILGYESNVFYDWKFYGDVRYEDGSKAPSDDVYTDVQDYDFSNATDRELEDLFNKILSQLELQNPDLSTIEGLLQAIYYRLGTLDSDNDNDLLSQIILSLNSLNNSISSMSDKFESSINDLKEAIKNISFDFDKDSSGGEYSGSNEEHDISGTLYNVIPLEKNWLNKLGDIFSDRSVANLKVEYQGKEYYLESDGCLKLDGNYYHVDMNYSSTLDEILYALFDIKDSIDSLSDEEKKMSFDEFFKSKSESLKSDFNSNFAFIDNIRTCVNNFVDSFENLWEESPIEEE